MNKTFWIGFVAVFVVAQVIGYVVHQVLLADTYVALADAFRPQSELMGMMWMMTVGSVVSLWLFCYIFTRGYEGKGISEGLRYGLLIGLFIAIPMAINQYVVYPVSSNLALIWAVTGVVGYIILGAVFAAIYKPAASTAHSVAAAT
ncbi:MAG: hypothetical protein WDZ50_05945 [Woeseia sp.]